MALSTWFATIQDVLSSASLPLAELAARGLALSLVVVLAALLVRTRSAQIRHAVWLTGVSLLLLLPLLQAVLPRWQVLPTTFPGAATNTSEPAREIAAVSFSDEPAESPLLLDDQAAKRLSGPSQIPGSQRQGNGLSVAHSARLWLAVNREPEATEMQ